MKAFALALISLTALIGYGKDEAPTMPVGVGGQVAEIGKYTPEEVKTLKASLGKIEFPATVGTVARLLSHPLKESPVAFTDWMADREKKGRVGGNIVEYWLSDEYVLQVATAYYAKGEDHFSREEWAVVLTKTEHEEFHRPVY